MGQVLCVTDEGAVSALLGVTALKSSPANTWGMSCVRGSPIRQGLIHAHASSCSASREERPTLLSILGGLLAALCACVRS